jgi:uncharacterized membrane protein
MWEIKNLKANARAVLKQNYWQAFLVSLILAMIGGGGFSVNWNLSSSDFSSGVLPDVGFNFSPHLIALVTTAILMGVLFVLAFHILLKSPLNVGLWKYFKEGQQYSFDLNHLGYAFNKTRYLDIVKTMLWRSVLTFVWSLLLIIPGIVAIYAYRMVPFILADNSNIGYKRAVKLSASMTQGHKFHIFLLDLSFLGWLLLGI